MFSKTRPGLRVAVQWSWLRCVRRATEVPRPPQMYRDRTQYARLEGSGFARNRGPPSLTQHQTRTVPLVNRAPRHDPSCWLVGTSGNLFKVSVVVQNRRPVVLGRRRRQEVDVRSTDTHLESGTRSATSCGEALQDVYTFKPKGPRDYQLSQGEGSTIITAAV